ncbi:MAG: site-specific integrase [Oscillospiraceae bacterium]|nr:site-specific integrase [Oscillospiraceae bacterium]
MPTYKDEKTGLWYCKFVFTDWTGEKRQKKKKGFRLQKEARAYETEFLSKEKASCDMLFSSLVDLYMEDCKARLKPTTYSGKEFLIGSHLIPYFGKMPLNKITATTIRKWQTTLISNPKRYSETYLKTVHNQISAIFNFACKYYQLSENPARVCGAMGKKNADCMNFWTVDEFKEFMEAISDKVVSQTVFNLLFWSGMRSGEMLALTLDDFDFEARTVSINKNYARLDNEDLILEPKTPKSKRKITLPPFLCDLIKSYAEKLVAYESTERLFNVTKHYLKHEMNRGCKKSGVKVIRIHDLRHSHASLLIEMGFSPLLISERLGHEDIKTTLQTYSHLYPNKQGEVADKLQSLY